jgi:hypothetical protein
LQNNSFSGPIPLEITRLTALTQIDLSNNRFNGTLPSMLGNLNRLTSLKLANNSFNGSVPKSFMNLTKVTELDLTKNKLTGDLPWMQSLKRCDLMDNTQLCRGKNKKCDAICDQMDFANVIKIWNALNGTRDAFPDGKVCNLNGVKCNAIQTVVTSIDWSGKQLAGRLPDATIAQLVNLTSL